MPRVFGINKWLYSGQARFSAGGDAAVVHVADDDDKTEMESLSGTRSTRVQGASSRVFKRGINHLLDEKLLPLLLMMTNVAEMKSFLRSQVPSITCVLCGIVIKTYYL